MGMGLVLCAMSPVELVGPGSGRGDEAADYQREVRTRFGEVTAANAAAHRIAFGDWLFGKMREGERITRMSYAFEHPRETIDLYSGPAHLWKGSPHRCTFDGVGSSSPGSTRVARSATGWPLTSIRHLEEPADVDGPT